MMLEYCFIGLGKVINREPCLQDALAIGINNQCVMYN